jgi:signal transduction histidine kinase
MKRPTPSAGIKRPRSIGPRVIAEDGVIREGSGVDHSAAISEAHEGPAKEGSASGVRMMTKRQPAWSNMANVSREEAAILARELLKIVEIREVDLHRALQAGAKRVMELSREMSVRVELNKAAEFSYIVEIAGPYTGETTEWMFDIDNTPPEEAADRHERGSYVGLNSVARDSVHKAHFEDWDLKLYLQVPSDRAQQRVADRLFGQSAFLVLRALVHKHLHDAEHHRAKATLAKEQLHHRRLLKAGHMVSEVIHELNNPIGAVMAYAEAVERNFVAFDTALRGADELHRQETRQRLLEALGRMQGSASRLQKTGRELTSYFHPRQENRTEVDMRRCLQQATSAIDHMRIEGRISIEWEASSTRVLGDEDALVRVFVNLLANAVQAIVSHRKEARDQGREGRIRIIMREMNDGARGQLCLVEIHDNGPGVPLKARSQIFEPFFTTKSSREGTGLGLAVAANVVESHGGEVEVADSSLGGAVFSVTLPLFA